MELTVTTRGVLVGNGFRRCAALCRQLARQLKGALWAVLDVAQASGEVEAHRRRETEVLRTSGLDGRWIL
jgi:hypothetical protein